MTRILLVLVVIFHFLVVFANVAAFFVLPFTSLITGLPFWFTVFLILPIESLILTLTFAREPCPLTRLENRLRKKLGMREIGGFIGYYIIKRKWRKGYENNRRTLQA
jgi:hypothetical protein